MGRLVTFGIARRGLGVAPPRYTKTTHPSTPSVPTLYYSMWQYNHLCDVKSYACLMMTWRWCDNDDVDSLRDMPYWHDAYGSGISSITPSDARFHCREYATLPLHTRWPGHDCHSEYIKPIKLLGLDQRSYSTLGPVSAWMGDRLWTGKPPWRRTRHPGLPWLDWNEYPAKAGGVNRHIAWYTGPYPLSCSVRWCLADGLANGDQRRPKGSGRALEACSRRCAIQINSYVTSRVSVCYTNSHAGVNPERGIWRRYTYMRIPAWSCQCQSSVCSIV